MKTKLLQTALFFTAFIGAVTFAPQNLVAKPNGCTSGGKGTTCCWVQDPTQPPGYLIKVCRRNI